MRGIAITVTESTATRDTFYITVMSVGNTADAIEGRKKRQSIALWLADVLTDPSCPLTNEQMCHYRLISHWLPDGPIALDRIENIFRGGQAELCDELYISLIVACIDKILGDTRPKTVTGLVKKAKASKSTEKKQPAPIKTLKLPSGQASPSGR